MGIRLLIRTFTANARPKEGRESATSYHPQHCIEKKVRQVSRVSGTFFLVGDQQSVFIAFHTAYIERSSSGEDPGV